MCSSAAWVWGGTRRPKRGAGGTFWQQVVNLPEVRTDPQMNIRINPHVIPGMAQAESISFFTGLTMRWFRDAFCAEEKLVAERLGWMPMPCSKRWPAAYRRVPRRDADLLRCHAL
jgi:sugar (pentulose or hexulose) kinase